MTEARDILVYSHQNLRAIWHHYAKHLSGVPRKATSLFTNLPPDKALSALSATLMARFSPTAPILRIWALVSFVKIRHPFADPTRGLGNHTPALKHCRNILCMWYAAPMPTIHVGMRFVFGTLCCAWLRLYWWLVTFPLDPGQYYTSTPIQLSRHRFPDGPTAMTSRKLPSGM